MDIFIASYIVFTNSTLLKQKTTQTTMRVSVGAKRESRSKLLKERETSRNQVFKIEVVYRTVKRQDFMKN